MKIHCFTCKKRLKITDNWIGKFVNCPNCKTSFELTLDYILSPINTAFKEQCAYNHTQRKAINWAKKVMAHMDNYIILDTETTGLESMDEIIEMSIINLQGEVLFNKRFALTDRKTISKGAFDCHGITIYDLKNCNKFEEYLEEIQQILTNKTPIIYNSDFDCRVIRQNLKICSDSYYRKPQFDLHTHPDCAMLKYSDYVYDWNDYYGNTKRQRLQGGDHSALGDCFATLKIIMQMANINPDNHTDSFKYDNCEIHYF